MKLMDLDYISDKMTMIVNYVKKSSCSKYKTKFCTLITLWSCSNYIAIKTILQNKYPIQLFKVEWLLQCFIIIEQSTKRLKE